MNYMAENLADILGQSVKAMQTIDAYIEFSEKLTFDYAQIETVIGSSPHTGFSYAKNEFIQSVNKLVRSEYDKLSELAIRMDMEINTIIGEYEWNIFSDGELLPILCEAWLISDTLNASYETKAPLILQSIRRLQVAGKNEFYICLSAEPKSSSACKSLTMSLPNSATGEEIANISVIASSVYKELVKTNPELYIKINGYHDTFNSKITFAEEDGWSVVHESNSMKTKSSKGKTPKNIPANKTGSSLESIFGKIVSTNETLRIKKWEKSLIAR